MNLHWVDEGDGYHHAHETEAGCSQGHDDAAFVLLSATTQVSINNLPEMTAEQAKRLVEKLYETAVAEIRARSEGSET